MLKSLKSFTGGYRFNNYINQASEKVLELKVPSRVIIPLRQGFGFEASLLVKKGDIVSAGQIISRDDNNISSPAHSSVNGVVEEIKELNYFKRKVSAVIIRPTGTSQEITRLPGCSPQWNSFSGAEIAKLIYLSGVSSLGKAGIPTRFKSSVIFPEQVKHLIIHASDSEPYNIPLDLLLKGNNVLNFLEGVKMLKKVMLDCKAHLAIDARKKGLIGKLLELSAKCDWLDIYPLEPKYPISREEVLVPALLKQRFPVGYSAVNIGVVVLDIEAVLGVYEAVVLGKPLVEKVIGLCGPSFQENIHLRTRVGTPLSEIFNGRLKTDFPSRVILNSLLMGEELSDFSLPVSRGFSKVIAVPENKEREFLAFARPGANSDSYTRAFLSGWIPGAKKCPDTNQHGEERACISCGYCEEVCPARIIPHLLSKYVEREIIDEKVINYGIFDCIECGLCNFVCPSKLPLLKHIKNGQEELAKEGLGRDKSVLPKFELKGAQEFHNITKV